MRIPSTDTKPQATVRRDFLASLVVILVPRRRATARDGGQ